MSNCASGSPNEGTGALNHSGSRTRASSRKAARRGQSGQSRSGPDEVDAAPVGAGPFLLFEIVVIAPRRRSGGAVQELRRVVAGLARGRALGRIAAELGLQPDEVGEDIGLTPPV